MQMQTDRIEWPLGDAGARMLGASMARKGAVASALLTVLEAGYGAVTAARNRAYERGLLPVTHAPMPVISVGNIVAGGAGKTPFTRWLAAHFDQRGKRVAVLHGGYGSDEPALHRKWLPGAIIVERKDRIAGAAQAGHAGADLILLDDGFQHRRLARDLDIVLVPVETTSNRLLPAGPLREAESGLERADVIVVTRKSGGTEQALQRAGRLAREYGRAVVVCALKLELPPVLDDECIAVSSIARPDLLLAQLRQSGANAGRLLAYPDHHEYSQRDIALIRRRADGLPIVTTEKDAIKLSAFFEPAKLRVVEQRIEIESGADALLAALARIT